MPDSAVADPGHALVTGGCRGIGAAISSALAAAGWRVTVTARDGAAAKRFAASLGAGCHGVAMDVADEASVAAGMAEARAWGGPLRLLVNNAGQAGSAPLAKTDPALLEQLWRINVAGVFACCRAALPDLLAGGHGRIINIASTAGLRGYAYVTAYAATKHAVIGLTRSLALELATRGVTVNAVCPGYTDTDIVREAVANIVAKTGRSEDEARAELARGNPQGRLVQPREVADAVLWLAGEGASSITGQSIAVAGGEVM